MSKADHPLARMREAREARKMSVEELAIEVGVSRPQIYKYEAGKLLPRAEMIARICRALQLPLEYFSAPARTPELTPLFFREFRSKASPKERVAAVRQLTWVQQFVDVIDHHVVLPDVNIPDFAPPSDPRLITNEEIERAATALRRHWGLGDGVIPDMTKLLEGNGCIVVGNLIDSPSMDGFSQWEHGGRPFIAIDWRAVSSAHRRIDVAHELGHLVLHRAVDKRFVEMTAETHKLIEQQAFRFAGAVMMPQATFTASVSYVSLDTLLLVKPQWKLSVAAMLHRAEDLGLIDSESARRLWINRNRRGWRTEEPFDDEIAFEEPRLLANAIEALRDSGSNAIAALCAEAALLPGDIARYAGISASDVQPCRDFSISLRSDDDLQAVL